MKTKTCRDCKSKIGKLLHYCPNCGRDFVDNIPGLGPIDGFPTAAEVIEKRNKISKLKPSASVRLCQNQNKTILDNEDTRAPIEDALYATGNFTTEICTELAEGIITYLSDADFIIIKKTPAKARLCETPTDN